MYIKWDLLTLLLCHPMNDVEATPPAAPVPVLTLIQIFIYVQLIRYKASAFGWLKSSTHRIIRMFISHTLARAHRTCVRLLPRSDYDGWNMSCVGSIYATRHTSVDEHVSMHLQIYFAWRAKSKNVFAHDSIVIIWPGTGAVDVISNIRRCRRRRRRKRQRRLANKRIT